MALCLLAFLISFPLFAGEQLMTKLYFDNWLKSATSPLDAQINQLRTSLDELIRAAAELKKEIFTEVKVVIGQKAASIDGAPVTMDVAPVIKDGRTMVPVRFIGEAFGAAVSWDGAVRMVTYVLEGVKIELTIGDKKARVNGKIVNLDAEPIIVNERTLVPLRFVGEHLHATFQWDAATQTVTILH